MYAVVRHGGHQYRVSPGDRLVVDRLSAEVGDVIGLSPVLLLSDADGVEVDAANLDGIRVAATVAAHRRGPKIRVFTFKPKKRHRRTLGFRADLTELVVDRFVASGEALPEPVTAEASPATEALGEEEAVPEATPEPAPPRRRRRAAGVTEPEAAEEVVTAEPAAPPVADEIPAAVEAAARPARRSRKPATAPEPEPAEPEEAAPAPAPSASTRRRAGRKATPPEAS
jgi:large subunit ribosomal protein L21